MTSLQLSRPGTNTLGVIFFCLAFGTVLGSLGNSGKQLVRIFGTIDQVDVSDGLLFKQMLLR